MSDPFLCDGPTIINVSGGETSALMLRRVLDAHGGTLPPDCRAVFANTGLEHEGTLRFLAECAERWGVDLVWIERDRLSPRGFRTVTFDTASREGEPFAELCAERRYLPNSRARFCTVALKIETSIAFMRTEGYTRWTSLVGLRADETRRVMTLRDREPDPAFDRAFPLYDAGIAKRDVRAWWDGAPFRLDVPPGAGNCRLCFLKGLRLREELMRAHPEWAAWWIEMERRISEMTGRDARFHAHEPGYAATLDRVQRTPRLPLVLDADEERDRVPCDCHDRRRRRCDCRRRLGPGRGHSLACPVRGVWAGEVAA